MIYLVLIALSLVLLGGFLLLAVFERRRGSRVAGAWRNQLDRKVAQAAFVLSHVDWGAFLKHLVTTALERALHDVAHFFLRLTRATERFLTRAVKSLRERRGMPASEDSEEGILAGSVRKVRSAIRSARRAARKVGPRE